MRLACLRYAHERGCPWDAETRQAARRHPACYAYVCRHGCAEDDT